MPTKIALTVALFCLAGLGAAPVAGAASQSGQPGGEARGVRVTVALLPRSTSLADLARVEGLSPGLLSAGLGDVPAEQTYLDMTQGSRIFDSLYDGELPPPPRGVGRDGRVEDWAGIVARADSAPEDIVPGLLASSVQSAGMEVVATAGLGSAPPAAGRSLGQAALLAANRAGRVEGAAAVDCVGACPALSVVSSPLAALHDAISRLRGRDLLIALQRPPPAENSQLALGIAGAGFDGNLTSSSTRTDGYVTSTDIAPTILGRLGIPVPDQMSGEPIRSRGEIDYSSLSSLAARMQVIPTRRAPVIGVSLLAWLLAAGAVAALTRGRLARPALKLLALSVAYLPLALLAGAALRPGEGVELGLLGLGAPALGALTLAALEGYRALAVACGVSTAACAIDVIAGSPLTSLSLIGPNPGGGFRFFGVGNELEAILAPLILVGTGAALAGFFPAITARGAASTFLSCGVALGLVFAAGRFGADVGAAIVLPAGAAVAAAVVAGRRRLALLAIAVPLAALALLALIDLLSGGDAHLTRSVLDAGGLHDLADVAERRLRLSARSFSRAAGNPIIYVTAAAIVVALAYRRRIIEWCRGYPAVRAGLIGAAAAAIVGTLANDSGALLLEVGAACLLAFAAFAWAQSDPDEKVGEGLPSKRGEGIPAGAAPSGPEGG